MVASVDKVFLTMKFSQCIRIAFLFDVDLHMAFSYQSLSVLIILPETVFVSPDNLREKLKKAIASKDVSALQSVIEEAEKAALPEVGSDLRKARDTLESLGGGRGG